MKKVLLIIAFLSIGVSFAQDARMEAKVISKFQKAYNASDYEAINELYSNEKKEAFSLENTKIFFERVHKSKGDITSLTLVRKEKKYTVYKAVFTKTVGEVIIKLNEKGKADVLVTRNTQPVY